MTDDQGYADISFNPDHPREVETPNMDVLAREGVFFSHAYTSGAVCSPTRAGLMLGQYQQRIGIYTAGDGGRGFNPKTKQPLSIPAKKAVKWKLGKLLYNRLNKNFSEDNK